MNGCLNKGSCIFDQEKETFACSCKQPWGGERYELRKPISILCNLFTARALFVFHYHLEIYAGIAIFPYSLSGYMSILQSVVVITVVVAAAVVVIVVVFAVFVQ